MMKMRQMKVIFFLAKNSNVACRLLNPRVACERTISSTSNYLSNVKKETKEVIIRDKIQLKKSTVTKFKRPPFAKNFFTGTFDTHLLEFPEILDKAGVIEIEYAVQCVNEVYKSRVESQKIEEVGKIPEYVLQELKDMGLFGRLVPKEYGGLGLNYTSLVRLNEVIGYDWSIFTTLAAHEFLGTQALLISGNEQQKAKYLPDLASGKCIAALCWAESASGSDLNSICTRATQSTDGKYFSLNGNKHWVTNGDLADIFIVFAKSELFEESEKVTAFVVEKDPISMTISPSDQKIGLCGTSTCSINFLNTQVPVENVIGVHGRGNEILLKALEICHFGMASSSFGVLKEMFEIATEHIINTVRFERPLADHMLVKERMAKLATTIYAMESAAYFTAALVDSTENPDFGMEAAILKVFNSENTQYCIRELMRVIGSSTLAKSHPFQRFYRDSQVLETFEGTNDIARLFIGLVGCQYIGIKKNEEFRISRNPAYYPWDNLKRIWKHERIMRGKVKYTQDIAGHLHPSLVIQATRLEESLQKFEVIAYSVLNKHGQDIIYTQTVTTALANITIDLYVMAAVLARSSRSYCIGLRNSGHEIRTCAAFCKSAYDRIQKSMKDIVQGDHENNTGNYMKLARNAIDWKGYYPQSPLKHNF